MFHDTSQTHICQRSSLFQLTTFNYLPSLIIPLHLLLFVCATYIIYKCCRILTMMPTPATLRINLCLMLSFYCSFFLSYLGEVWPFSHPMTTWLDATPKGCLGDSTKDYDGAWLLVFLFQACLNTIYLQCPRTLSFGKSTCYSLVGNDDCYLPILQPRTHQS